MKRSRVPFSPEQGDHAEFHSTIKNKRMNRIVLGLFTVTFLLFSCKKDQEPPADYLVFGTFSAGCETGCFKLFQLSGGQLYEAMPGYSFVQPQTQLFSSDPLPVEKYTAARELLDDFPEYLRNSAGEVFGCPNCFDQGGLYLEQRQDGKIRKWKIDPNDHPAELGPYIQQINLIVGQL